MKERRVLGALIGLTGAISNNGKTEDTDRIVVEALSDLENEKMLDAVHKEKSRISPNCETCKCPCGNTSDFDFESSVEQADDILQLKKEIVEGLREFGKRKKQSGNYDLPDGVYKALTYLKYDMDADSYKKILEEIRVW